MEYRDFGTTGLKVSAIGFGCWETGGGYGAFHEEEVRKAVHRALDLGITCFDTAMGYGEGQSERILGEALKGRRDEAVVVTKFGIPSNPERKNRDSRREHLMASAEQSLKNLGMDHIDVMLVHWPDRAVPWEEPMRALEDLMRAGKIRFGGISNFKAEEIETCMKTRRVDVAQYGYHLFDRRMERDVFPVCAKHRIGVMAYGSLAHGILAGAFTEETKFDEKDWRNRGDRPIFGLTLFAPDNFRKELRAVARFKQMAARRGKKVAHLALAWVLSNPVISTALVGFRSASEVEDNIEALGWQLSDEERREIDTICREEGIDPAPNTWLEQVA